MNLDVDTYPKEIRVSEEGMGSSSESVVICSYKF
jgi:hypothetical protein